MNIQGKRHYRATYGFPPMDYPAAYAADRLTVALPFYPQMRPDEVDHLFQSLAAASLS